MIESDFIRRFVAWWHKPSPERSIEVCDFKLRTIAQMEMWQKRREAGKISDADWAVCLATYKEAMAVEA